MEIADKDKVVRKFVPWPVQRKLVEGLTGRDVVVKDSSIGCTSILTGLFTKHTITEPNTTTVIMAHEEFLTQRLLHRAQLFYDSVPTQLKPDQDHGSSYEKRFPSINSVMYIVTARSQVAGRGEPIHRLLVSEEAFYVEGAHNKIILPALQRVPESGWVVRESTPNGESGSFYEEVQAAIHGESTFKLHTLFWWENPSNSLSQRSKIAERLDLVDLGQLKIEETQLVNTYGISEDQVRWRRWKIMETGDMFFQEHLESLDTCFLTVGEPYYAPLLTLALTKGCYPAPHTGPHGLMIWFQPEPGGVYVMGIDPGQGRTTESVVHIWRADLDHPRHEARLATFDEPDAFAPKCEDIGRYYGNALAIPEANAHGLGLIARMRIRYPRMYYRRDIIRGQTSMQYGWLTTPSTKPFMMQTMSVALANMETHDAEFVRQMRGFKDVGMGKVVSITSDDHHDAGALSQVGMIGMSVGQANGFQGTSGWNW